MCNPEDVDKFDTVLRDVAFSRLPNHLPTIAAVSNTLLVPQSGAGTPIDGTSWSLVFTYERSVVTKVSEFTTLSHRKKDTELATTHA
jgi:hypothetical protein